MSEADIERLVRVAMQQRRLKRFGFEIKFVFGLLPVPYHPLLVALLPLAIAAWLAWPVLAGAGPVPWTRPLWLWLALGALLSVPILGWFLPLFGIHWLQSAMLPAAMAMLALAVARGEAVPALLALPIGYFGVHLALAVAGRVVIARARRAAADVAATAAIAPPGPMPPVLLIGRTPESMAVQKAIATANLAEVHAQSSRTAAAARRWVRVDAEGLAQLRAAPGFDRECRVLAGAGGVAGLSLVEMPADALPIDAVRVERTSTRLGTFWLGGNRTVETAEAPGRPPVHHVGGRYIPLSWWPGFVAFIQIQLGGGGGRWVRMIGFVPGRPQSIGDGDEATALTTLLSLWQGPVPPAAAPRVADVAPPRLADVAPLVAALAHAEAQQQADRQATLAAYLANQPLPARPSHKALLDTPALYASEAEALCAAFMAARQAQDAERLYAIAALLAALPPDAFLRIRKPLLACLNSHEVWRAPRGRSVEAFRAANGKVQVRKVGEERSGLDLLRRVPALYRRLGELGEPARPHIEAIGKASGWPEPLVTARATLDGAAPGE